MNNVKLTDRDGKCVDILEVGKEINSVGVILYKGDYYTYHSYNVETVSGNLTLIFAVTNIMEVAL